MSATTERPTAPATGMPYRVQETLIGIDRKVQMKVYDNDVVRREFMTDDEVAVLAYVRHLEAEVERLTAELDAATAPQPAAPPPAAPQPAAPQPAAEKPARAKGK